MSKDRIFYVSTYLIYISHIGSMQTNESKNVDDSSKSGFTKKVDFAYLEIFCKFIINFKIMVPGNFFFRTFIIFIFLMLIKRKQTPHYYENFVFKIILTLYFRILREYKYNL